MHAHTHIKCCTASDSEDDVHVGDDEEHSVTAESSPERLLLVKGAYIHVYTCTCKFLCDGRHVSAA